MRPTLAALALLALLAGGAAPAPDPLLDKIIASARAVPPTAISFERNVKAVGEEAGAAPETQTRTDRWDGRQLTLVTMNGKPPTATDLAEYRKAAAGKPIPGYHRLADFLKGGAVRVSDAQGRIVYRVTGLPKGSINVGKDISGDVVADASVDVSGPQPFVSKLRIYLPKPLSFFMVAKLDRFEIVNDYRLGSDGRPTLFHSSQSLTGAQFGKSGTTRTEMTYTQPR